MLKNIAHVAKYALLNRIYYEMPVTPTNNDYITRDSATSELIYRIQQDYGDVRETPEPEYDLPQEPTRITTDRKRSSFSGLFHKSYKEVKFDPDYVFSTDYRQYNQDIEGMSVNLNTYYRRCMAYYASKNDCSYKQCPTYESDPPDNAYLDWIRLFLRQDIDEFLSYNVVSMCDTRFKPRYGLKNRHVVDFAALASRRKLKLLAMKRSLTRSG